MVPCLLWWEFVKGFLREDISEVVVLGQHHVLEGSAYLSFLCFLGQPLRWGIRSPNVVFCPLRGDERCRWGETQSHAPNQPNQIHTTPNTEPRRSRTKNPRQTSCIWFNRQLILLQSSPIKLSSQSLSPKPSEPNLIKTLILDS